MNTFWYAIWVVSMVVTNLSYKHKGVYEWYLTSSVRTCIYQCLWASLWLQSFKILQETGIPVDTSIQYKYQTSGFYKKPIYPLPLSLVSLTFHGFHIITPRSCFSVFSHLYHLSIALEIFPSHLYRISGKLPVT